MAAAGTDPFLAGCVTWRKGGTQRDDGHWKDLRAGVASRGYNARNASELDHCVRVHQWAYWAGPGKCLFTELGRLVRRVRVRRAQHVAAARAEDRAQRAQQWLQQVIGRARHANDDTWERAAAYAAMVIGRYETAHAAAASQGRGLLAMQDSEELRRAGLRQGASVATAASVAKRRRTQVGEPAPVEEPPEEATVAGAAELPAPKAKGRPRKFGPEPLPKAKGRPKRVCVAVVADAAEEARRAEAAPGLATAHAGAVGGSGG